MLNNSIKRSQQFIFIVFTVLALTVFNIPLAAQDKVPGLTLSPLGYSGNFAPGSKLSTKFTLTNSTASSTNIVLTVGELKTQGGVYNLTEDNGQSSSWVSLNANSFSLKPNEVKTIEINVNVPSTTTFGAYFPAILIKQTSINENGATVIEPVIAFQLSLNITGIKPIASIQVTELKATNPTLFGKTTISYKITNPLQLYIKPIAYLQIINPQGVPVYRSTINENLNILKPNESISNTVDVDLPNDILGIGQYRVELLAIDNQFGGSDILKVQFIGFPGYSLLVLVTLIGILLVAISLLTSKRIHARKIKK